MGKLSPDELRRYNRHIILPDFGLEGQEKLKESSVLLIGAGGLGSPAALYLAAAGVGRIGIVDFDVVDESNLQRQIIHGQSTIGKLKLESARARLEDINRHIKVETYEVPLTSENALELFEGYDVIADGTDNFPTRYLVNDACVLAGKPNVYASIFRFEGQLSVFHYQGGPCYRCLYSEPPPPGLVPSCAEGGVLGVLPGVVGSMQANEVIKVLTGIGEVAAGRLIMYDALRMKFRELKLRRNPDCVICGDHPTQKELIDYQLFCGVPTQEESVGQNEYEISVQELKARMDRGDDFVLIDVREPFEHEISNIEKARLIPLSELEDHLSELDQDADYVIHCKSGGRSARAVDFLRAQGFENVKNLVGGINAWAQEVDTSLPTY
ncbi:MAG: molybdopterin-synthase adenylyltransferase MoeB [Spirochaetales bacterium]|nr:molybdopterin-synthase adenylyltransferase MoeB [Leptospiraceae bacterium]MCP5483117.1 molybdopterin-synthase adenylyltransferase MoeB [Spirochaetales bacterium]MCP5484557.1 molybdopterin-synthase adenylyltransferase MoeB [Spirochaetales bacterium]